jgi:hypothetical protein
VRWRAEDRWLGRVGGEGVPWDFDSRRGGLAFARLFFSGVSGLNPYETSSWVCKRVARRLREHGDVRACVRGPVQVK